MDFRAALIADGMPEGKVDAFLAFHTLNRDVWKEFERIALELAGAGARRWSAMTILGVIRYEREVKQQGKWKVNNNWQPFYARVFCLKYPQHKGLFKTKKTGGRNVSGADATLEPTGRANDYASGWAG